MKSITLSVLLLLAGLQIVTSQTLVDSLLTEINEQKGANKAECLNKLSLEYFFAGDYDNCIKFANEALSFSRRIKNSLNEAKALNNLAIVHSQLNKIEEARKFAFDAFKIAKEGKHKEEMANAYNTLGLSYDNDLDKAEQYHEKALKIREEIDDKPGIAKSQNNLGLIYADRGQYDKAIESYKKALTIKEELGDKRGAAILYSNIGNIYLQQDQNELAIAYLQKALKIFEEINFVYAIAVTLNTNGLIYENMGSFDKALEYYKKAMKLQEQIDDKKGISNSLSNIGNIYSLKGDNENAINFYQQALAERKKLNDQSGIAISLQTIGVIYTRWKNYEKALSYYLQALEINQNLGNQKEIAYNHLAIAKNYTSLKDYGNAINYYNKSLEISIPMGLLKISKDIYLDLSGVYKNLGNLTEALNSYEKYSIFKDSILNEDIFNRISELQTVYETEKKEQEIKLLNKDKLLQSNQLARQRLVIIFFIIGLALVSVLVIVILRSLRQKQRDNEIIAAEKAKSEELLLNTLPLKVVNDLKENGKTEPEGFDNVTVYFSDIVGFTDVSSELDPKTLINELNDIFTSFDDIMISHQCERIKTIGDAYMAVCGMPQKNDNHAQNMLDAALEIVDYLQNRSSESNIQWRIRVGIHSGKVVGGIVGVRKYIYDVFGDTINTASRMESSSEPMRINISEKTYELIKDQYITEERDRMKVKGKGDMKMYFVDGRKPALIS